MSDGLDDRRFFADLQTETGIDARPKCIRCGERWCPPEGVDAQVTECIPCRDKVATRPPDGMPGEPAEDRTKAAPGYEVFPVRRESGPTCWYVRTKPDGAYRREHEAVAASWAHRDSIRAAAPPTVPGEPPRYEWADIDDALISIRIEQAERSEVLSYLKQCEPPPTPPRAPVEVPRDEFGMPLDSLPDYQRALSVIANLQREVDRLRGAPVDEAAVRADERRILAAYLRRVKREYEAKGIGVHGATLPLIADAIEAGGIMDIPARTHKDET